MRKRQEDYDEEPIRVEIEAEEEAEAGAGVEPEMEAAAPDVDELQNEIERLRVELEEERKRTKDEHDQHLRALADFSNYRRRQQEEYNRAIQFATQEIILKILPAIDNFERALRSAEQAENFEGLVEGVKLTLRQLRDVIEREGVEPIESVGQEFDPMLHEAVMRVETEEYPENTIVEEVQTGYKQHDRVIRPARVVVAGQASNER
ncbi:MAG: nucleotide exchange factor GrpE [Armatimonadetes bacterium]|nr:nucleotide exchange factor GrpE [Armatimonadota bacterium]